MMRSILTRVAKILRMPQVPVVERDIDLIRETSLLRLRESSARARRQSKMDRIDDLYARALTFVKERGDGQ